MLRVARQHGFGIVPSNVPVLMCGAILANAALYISGRFHATIFASLGGTPCIFLDAHSHKMSSLMRTLEYDSTRIFSAFPENGEIGEIIDLAKGYVQNGMVLRNRIKLTAGRRCEEAGMLTEMIEKHV